MLSFLASLSLVVATASAQACVQRISPADGTFTCVTGLPGLLQFEFAMLDDPACAAIGSPGNVTFGGANGNVVCTPLINDNANNETQTITCPLSWSDLTLPFYGSSVSFPNSSTGYIQFWQVNPCSSSTTTSTISTTTSTFSTSTLSTSSPLSTTTMITTTSSTPNSLSSSASLSTDSTVSSSSTLSTSPSSSISASTTSTTCTTLDTYTHHEHGTETTSTVMNDADETVTFTVKHTKTVCPCDPAIATPSSGDLEETDHTVARAREPKCLSTISFSP